MKRMKDILRHISNGNVAHALRTFNANPRSSASGLANALGLSVEKTQLRRGRSGYLIQDEWSEAGYKIVVNSKDSFARQRFTILHEIFHFLLHGQDRDLISDAQFRDTGLHLYNADELKEEREANQCAATLLFSEGNLRRAMIGLDENAAAVAKHFGVSEEVVRRGIRDHYHK